jgi:hypothetical protein
VEAATERCLGELPAEAREKTLALNPDHVTEQEVRDVLSQMPAPRIINIHGGLLPIKNSMVSFSEFLIGMGYPEVSLRNPGGVPFVYGHYDNCDQIAGMLAWYYERDGLRPMIMGHSLGGVQAVRVLHKLAGDPTPQLHVWNPVTGTEETRCEIVDPLTGTNRPVVGLQLSYVTAVASGGMARILPKEWDMNSKLRVIPDSVEEFTGFQKGLDMLGGDYLGYGPANDYHATGTASVRNVRLPAMASHSTIPYTKELLKTPAMKTWIENYQPAAQNGDAPAVDPGFGLKSAQVLWAAEVWYGIKKHWVLELQRLIRTQQTPHS